MSDEIIQFKVCKSQWPYSGEAPRIIHLCLTWPSIKLKGIWYLSKLYSSRGQIVPGEDCVSSGWLPICSLEGTLLKLHGKWLLPEAQPASCNRAAGTVRTSQAAAGLKDFLRLQCKPCPGTRWTSHNTNFALSTVLGLNPKVTHLACMHPNRQHWPGIWWVAGWDLHSDGPGRVPS